MRCGRKETILSRIARGPLSRTGRAVSLDSGAPYLFRLGNRPRSCAPRGRSIAEVLELQGDGEVVASESGDNRLKVIPAFAADANLFRLNLRSDFQVQAADVRSDILCDLRLDALFDSNDLSGMAQGRNVRVFLLDAFETDVSLRELAEDNFSERLDLELVVGGQLDFVLIENNFGLGALEIEPIGEFFLRDVHAVLDFHRVHLGDDVE